MDSEPPAVGELSPPDRTLMGPGPTDVHDRVRRAAAAPLVGYLDDYYVSVMDDLQELLRYVFRTDNEHTFVVSGTGSAAMETSTGVRQPDVPNWSTSPTPTTPTSSPTRSPCWAAWSSRPTSGT
jgi:hypothetical protein